MAKAYAGHKPLLLLLHGREIPSIPILVLTPFPYHVLTRDTRRIYVI